MVSVWDYLQRRRVIVDGITFGGEKEGLET